MSIADLELTFHICINRTKNREKAREQIDNSPILSWVAYSTHTTKNSSHHQFVSSWIVLESLRSQPQARCSCKTRGRLFSQNQGQTPSVSHIIVIVFCFREVGTEDLVTFTSSKKTPTATEPEPAEAIKDTGTISNPKAEVESESHITDTESPPSNKSASSYSSPL